MKESITTAESGKEKMTGVIQSQNNDANNYSNAFTFLKSLPRNIPELDTSYKKEKDPSAIIDCDTAKEYTERFRVGVESMDIPICWSFDKAALLNLLGITSCEHYEEVNGVRFYAGVNASGLMTLVAVSTSQGTRENCNDCRNDLTVNEEYPYYDYADPCPTNCSDRGNLAASGEDERTRKFNRD